MLCAEAQISGARLQDHWSSGYFGQKALLKNMLTSIGCQCSLLYVSASVFLAFSQNTIQ